MISANDLAKLPKARLNKQGTYAVCARLECGRRLLERRFEEMDVGAWL